MRQKRARTALVGSASLGCFIYIFAFVYWATQFFPRLWRAAWAADFLTLENIFPGMGILVLHFIATLVTLALMGLFVGDVWNRASLSRMEQSAWTAGLLTVGPLLYPAYFWLYYRKRVDGK